jgi:uncharacterized membrane protein
VDEFVLARVLHVLGVVLWIGGVAMVTTVLFPVLAPMKTATERMDFFHRFRRRFAIQARFTTLIVGVTGFYMVHVMDAWHRFMTLHYWWMHAMVLVWVIFTMMLFVMMPLAQRRQQQGKQSSAMLEKSFVKIQRMHRILLVLSLITVAGAVAGSHGWLLTGV